MSIDPVRKAVNKTACSLYEINAHIRLSLIDPTHSEDILPGKIDKYLECLRELSLASKNDNREVPVDVIATLDSEENNNPTAITVNLLKNTEKNHLLCTTKHYSAMLLSEELDNCLKELHFDM